MSQADRTFRVGELTEDVSMINNKLIREFGKEFDGRAKWRVVWADTELEKRRIDVTPEGMQLLFPEVREVKKYQHISERYVLERLIPVFGETDIVTPMSYEPVWTFEDRFQNYLPPIFEACKFIVEGIYGQLDKANTHKKYKDTSTSPEERDKLVRDTEAKLFGNETSVGDALGHGYGVTVPNNYERTSDKKSSEGKIH